MLSSLSLLVAAFNGRPSYEGWQLIASDQHLWGGHTVKSEVGGQNSRTEPSDIKKGAIRALPDAPQIRFEDVWGPISDNCLNHAMPVATPHQH